METVLVTLLLVQLIATSAFSRFEIETPLFKKLFKWLVIHVVTIGLYQLVGLWAVVFPLLMVFIGTLVHLRICKKHGFDPIKATPRKKYYAFRNWEWYE